MKVLVVDDEKVARESLVVLLQEHFPQCEPLQAATATEALTAMIKASPAFVFLDIQLPDMTGMELAKLLPEHVPIVFVTAFEQHAIDAFGVNAIDYLLKPLDSARFLGAMQKTLRYLQGGLRNAMVPVDAASIPYSSRLVIKDPGRIRLVDISQILYITGAGNYAELHLDNGHRMLHRETLNSLETHLDPGVFTRIHRSALVRRDAVVELRPKDKGDYSVILHSGDTLTLSRSNRDKLEALLGS